MPIPAEPEKATGSPLVVLMSLRGGSGSACRALWNVQALAEWLWA